MVFPGSGMGEGRAASVGAAADASFPAGAGASCSRNFSVSRSIRCLGLERYTGATALPVNGPGIKDRPAQPQNQT